MKHLFLILYSLIALVNSDLQSSPYIQNPYVHEEIWKKLNPHFLPEDHPVKETLDHIFSSRRVLSSEKSVLKAEFIIIRHPIHQAIVAKHPKLKGYLVKMYLDYDLTNEWLWWEMRINGAKIIQESIDKYGYQDIMKVPKKWIYPVPPEPPPKNDKGYRKNFILVVEDMQILSSKKNFAAWKKKITPSILDALYRIITENLLIDSVYADNIPFCKDGKIAFIDTEFVMITTKEIPLTDLGDNLSKKMLAYWEQLLVNGLP